MRCKRVSLRGNGKVLVMWTSSTLAYVNDLALMEEARQIQGGRRSACTLRIIAMLGQKSSRCSLRFVRVGEDRRQAV